MRGEQHNTVFRKVCQQIAQAHALFWVQPGSGLVQHQYFRFIQQRLGNAKALLHSAGKCFYPLFRHPGQRHFFQKLRRLLLCLRPGQALQRRNIKQKILRGVFRVIAEILRKIAQQIPVARVHGIDAFAIQQHFA